MNNKNYIDITVNLRDKIPSWPGSPGFSIFQYSHLHEDVSNNSRIEMDLHVGTHIDAPRHFINAGKSIDELDMTKCIGEVYVSPKISEKIINGNLLSILSIPPDTKRLLLHTTNSFLWQQKNAEFQKDFAALSADGAQWLVDHDIIFVGIDYLSIQRFGDPGLTHEILLRNEVVILEGIDLTDVAEGLYKLICLPLKIQGADGAPARVLLERL